MIAAYRSEWLLLNRARLWIAAGLVMLAFTVGATWLAVANAEAPGPGAGPGGLTTNALAGAGGATAGVIWALAFGSLLVLAAFASSTANEFTRGTFRAALLHHAGRWSLVAGKTAARMSVAAVLLAIAIVAGAATAAVAASRSGISTTDWFSPAGIADAGADYLRLLAWGAGFALIGTTVAVLVRSTPITLAAVVLWFGPIENVIGDGSDWAQRWFPGLLLRAIVSQEQPDALPMSTVAPTLLGYGAVCVAVLAVVLSRRDVTG